MADLFSVMILFALLAVLSVEAYPVSAAEEHTGLMTRNPGIWVTPPTNGMPYMVSFPVN